jgi:hypothetical protein
MTWEPEAILFVPRTVFREIYLVGSVRVGILTFAGFGDLFRC